MKNKYKHLIDQFVLLKSNSDYRVYDLITRFGARWRESKHQIMTKDVYSDTLLFKYFKARGKRARLDANLFLKTLIEHRNENNYAIPDKNELVIHLRLGDHALHNDFLSKNYVELINEQIDINKNINKITIVGAFAYQVWSEDTMDIKPDDCPTWEYTEELQQKNETELSRVLSEIIQAFNLPLNVYSNLDIDKDICYCVSAKNFICDVGNLGGLMKKLGQTLHNNN